MGPQPCREQEEHGSAVEQFKMGKSCHCTIPCPCQVWCQPASHCSCATKQTPSTQKLQAGPKPLNLSQNPTFFILCLLRSCVLQVSSPAQASDRSTKAQSQTQAQSTLRPGGFILTAVLSSSLWPNTGTPIPSMSLIEGRVLGQRRSLTGCTL